MIILGIILLLIGWLASISILTTIGIILIIIGVVLWILGATGRAVGGRKYWYYAPRGSPIEKRPRCAGAFPRLERLAVPFATDLHRLGRNPTTGAR
jgi:hypothetical protein